MLFKRNLKNQKMIIFNLSNKSINKINIYHKLYFIIMNIKNWIIQTQIIQKNINTLYVIEIY